MLRLARSGWSSRGRPVKGDKLSTMANRNRICKRIVQGSCSRKTLFRDRRDLYSIEHHTAVRAVLRKLHLPRYSNPGAAPGVELQRHLRYLSVGYLQVVHHFWGFNLIVSQLIYLPSVCLHYDRAMLRVGLCLPGICKSDTDITYSMRLKRKPNEG